MCQFFEPLCSLVGDELRPVAMAREINFDA